MARWRSFSCFIATLASLLYAGCSNSDESTETAADAGSSSGGQGAAASGCPTGQVMCTGTCADLDSNPSYCGACDNPCPIGEVCSFGECSDACDPGLTACGRACVDLATSSAHCGACDAGCAANESCAAGQCVPAPPSGTGGAGTGGTGGISGSGGLDAAAGDSGGASATGGAGGLDSGTGGAPTVDPLDITVMPVEGSTTVGLEWPVVAGATSYNVYWSTSPGVNTTNGNLLQNVPRGHIHDGLSDGTTYYYVVTAVTAAGESAPSPEVSATPGGVWVLEQLGTGDFDDLDTGDRTQIPVESRVQVLLFAEGYTASDLDDFDTDVGDWINLVFSIEPYSLFPEAFVVWSIPAVSANTIRDSNPTTAFMVPVDASGSFAQMGSVSSTGETATLAWAQIAQHPYPPTDFSGPSFRRARNAIAAFLIYDPNRGRASVSGRASSLTNPADSNQRIAAAFGVGHAHEFSHSFANIRDEYLENDNSAPSSWSGTSNVVGTNVCSELPWAHLLYGTTINPDTDQLVGAFGTAAHGYHSELLCLINGTHDNGEYYARGDSGRCQPDSCTLRVEDRLCNFCRETAALRIFQRTGVLDADDNGFDAWVATYRQPFYDGYGFVVPAVVPQSNDRTDPADGTPIFEACAP